MPTIEVYNSKNRLDVQPIGPTASPAEMGGIAASALTQAGAHLEQTMSVVTQRFDALRDLTQSTQAETKAGQGLQALKEQSLTDPDLYNTDKYRQQMQQIQTEAAKGITSPTARARFENSMASTSLTTLASIGSTLRKRQIQAGTASMNEATNQLTSQIITAQSPQEKALIIQQMESLHQDFARQGIITTEDARVLSEKTRKSMGIEDVYSLIGSDPAAAIAQLKSGAYDGLYGLTPKDKAELTNRAESKLKSSIISDSVLRKAERLSTRLDFLQQLSTGQTPWNAVEQQLPSLASRDPELATTVSKVIQYGGVYPPGSDSPSRVMEDVAFANVAKKMFALNDPDALGSFLLSSLRDARDGSVTQARLGTLTALAREHALSLSTPTPQSQQASSLHTVLRNAVDYIGMAIPLFAPVATMDLLNRRFSAQQMNAAQIKQTAQQVIRDQVRQQYPSVRSLPGVPNMVIDGDGAPEPVYNGDNEFDSSSGFFHSGDTQSSDGT